MNISYDGYFVPDFSKNLEKLTRRNLELKRRIDKKIREMRNDPFRGSIHLVGKGTGKRRVYVAGDYRLIYAVCHECREKGHNSINQCIDCEQKSNNSIIYFDVEHRKHAYNDF